MTRDSIGRDRRSASNARVAVRWVRLRLEGWGRGPSDVLGELDAVVYAINSLERAALLYVSAARDSGHSWTSIAAVLGVTRQAARQRYGRALNRREAFENDWRRELAGVAGVTVNDRTGVWEGRLVDLGDELKQAKKRREQYTH